MTSHDLLDVAVTVEDGSRRFTGQCRCGWLSHPVTTAVHALALVEDHVSRARQLARRRPSAAVAPAPTPRRP